MKGKIRKGIFPASANFSTDLHSLGQYIQEGRRDLFETVIKVRKPRREITIEEAENDLDGLNYLAGKTVDFVNNKAFEGTLLSSYRWWCSKLNCVNTGNGCLYIWLSCLLSLKKHVR